MNTLTIAVLLVCATMAYAAVLPGSLSAVQEAQPLPEAAEPVEELLQGAESAYPGHGHHYGGGYGHHYGGGHGHHRGGHYGYYGHHGRGHGYGHGYGK